MKGQTIRALRAAVRQIKKMPQTFNMIGWLDHDSSVRPGKFPKPYCGTVACLGGHVVLAAGWEPSGYYEVSKRGRVEDVESVARRVLGITPSQTDRLFFTGHWPMTFRLQYDKARTSRGQASAVAARVEHFIQTGE